MSMILDGSNGVTFNDSSLQGAAASPFGLKNRIINGDMRIDQRNAGASATVADATYYLDRWKFFVSQASKLTVQQNLNSVTPPTGFTNYLGVSVAATATIGSTDYFGLYHYIEGYNASDLAWGTANAKTITLSFWVRSSATGTFGAALRNNGGSRSYPFTYTISAANTWEYKTVTIAGDTSGTWLTTNGVGTALDFSFGMGSTYSGTAGVWASAAYDSATGATSIMGTSGATFYITGVQLEVGSTATPFERRLYTTEQQLCYRYYYKLSNLNGSYYAFGSGHVDAATTGFATLHLPVSARTTPTFGSSGSTTFYSANTFYPITSYGTAYYTSNSLGLNFTCSGGGMTAGRAGQIVSNNSLTSYLDFSMEL